MGNPGSGYRICPDPDTGYAPISAVRWTRIRIRIETEVRIRKTVPVFYYEVINMLYCSNFADPCCITFEVCF